MTRLRRSWARLRRRRGRVVAVLTVCGSTAWFTTPAASPTGAATAPTAPTAHTAHTAPAHTAPAHTAPAHTAPAHTAPALCAASAVQITATTNRTAYGPGQSVRMTSSVTNVSGTACSLWLGLDPGFSPSFVVVDSKKKEVWDRCWVEDHPGACFEILYQHRLDPGRSYHATAMWDQGSATGSRPPRRVNPGTYTFQTYYQYISGATVSFHVNRAGGRPTSGRPRG